MSNVIYLDMDGVLADFEGLAADVFGPNWKAEIQSPNWGRFGDRPDWFAILPVMPYAKELFETAALLVGINNVRILTALPNRSEVNFPNAAKDKIEWVQKHIHPKLRVSFGPYAQDKQHHCVHHNDVLVDDQRINIEQWIEAGGIGLHHDGDMQETIIKLHTLSDIIRGK